MGKRKSQYSEAEYAEHLAQCKARYEAKRDVLFAQKKVYREANPDKIAARKKAYREENLAKIAAKDKAYREANPDKIAARHKAYREANREKRAAQQKVYHQVHREANRAKFYARCAKRRAMQLQRTPAWADLKAIEAIYAEAAFLNKIIGGAHVDHYYPLRGKKVSGLHVAANLRILTDKENLAKSNKMPEELETA